MTVFPGVPNEFIPNTLADADEVNENFDFIKSWLNGKNIDCADNIADGGITTDCIADDAVTADKLSNDLLEEIRTKPQARVQRIANLTVGDANPTIVPFDDTVYESVEMHDTVSNNTRVVIPEDGVYSIKAQVKWDNTAGLAGKTTYARLIRNGSASMGRMDTTGSSFNTQVSVQVVNERRLLEDDYVQLEVYHENGANLDALAGSVWMVVRKVSDA